MKTSLLFLVIVLGLSGCSTPQEQSQESEGLNGKGLRRATAKSLTEENAKFRSKLLSEIKYSMYFDLSTPESDYAGTTEINFKLSEKSNPITLDFSGGTVAILRVNGQVISNPNYNGFFITIPSESLVTGENSVEVEFKHAFGSAGTGLHRFKDPEDSQIYLYTHFEPYDANQFFPCFDQPDLKGTYKLKVLAPKGWTLISSTRESRIENKDSKNNIWYFPESAKFSTYLISLHAGPYNVWSSGGDKIPLRVFARKSLAKFVNIDDWFSPTRKGLRFYGKYFDYEYPFAKYDQVIVPDFNAGAMENVAAVTFSERSIQRGKPTLQDRERLAEVILHEMAHMWFGDLVTMKWWNGLWLNESFATFMSYLAIKEDGNFPNTWMTFFVGEKRWAYFEDQMVTTHPIEVEVPDTEQAFANFDGITYGKGASVLKQLNYYIGADKFREGVRGYFKKYAFQNAELKDFMGSIAESAQTDLSGWTKDWLETAGLNTLTAQITCHEKKISEFFLIQGAPTDHSLLRSHRTEVGLFKKSKSGMVLSKTMPISYAGEKTDIPQLIGEECPALAFVNTSDQDYVKVSLDPVSLETAKKLKLIGDPHTRIMVWNSLWDMVRDNTMPVAEYADLIFDNLKNEKEIKIVDQVLNTVYGRWSGGASVFRYFPKDSIEAMAFRQNYVEKLEQFVWDQIQKSKAGSDFQKRWYDGYVRISESNKAQKNLLKILSGTLKVPGLIIDQDRRWDIVYRINSISPQLGSDLLNAETKKDASNAGVLSAISAEASRPEALNKAQWMEKILAKPSSMPFNQLRSAMQGLFPAEQENLREQFSSSFFKSLPEVVNSHDSEFQESFARNLSPTVCNESSVEKLEKYLNETASLTPVILKELKVAHQEDQRCLKIRQSAKRSIPKLGNKK